MLPESHYVGIDVGDYNQTRPISANEYITTSGDLFAAQIERFDAFFDAVISSHNLEHCDERDRCLRAMLRALKKDGRIFLSFPCAESVTFPSRKGTLNYYDDYTHKAAPPDLASVKSILQELNCEIEFVSERYSPLVLSAIGAIFEPLSRIRRKTMIGTWEFYGFETILVARRVKI